MNTPAEKVYSVTGRPFSSTTTCAGPGAGLSGMRRLRSLLQPLLRACPFTLGCQAISWLRLQP